MKTLMFAPMYLDEGQRLDRNIKWLRYYIPMMNKELKFDQMYFVDNASSSENVEKLLAEIRQQGQFNINFYFREVHLPRWEMHAYGYWYVAFAKAVEYAMKNGFDKIVHIDTDVYLLNQRICDYVNSLNSGWTSMWCGMYNYPESTFQVICKDQFEKAHRWFTEDFLQFYPKDIAETRIPWTHVEKGFKGDRYGERVLQQTPDMEWYGQAPVDIHLRFNK